MKINEGPTWQQIVYAILTSATLQFAIQGTIVTWIVFGIVNDMNNTDAMINRRIDSVEHRLNSWKNSAEQQQ